MSETKTYDPGYLEIDGVKILSPTNTPVNFVPLFFGEWQTPSKIFYHVVPKISSNGKAYKDKIPCLGRDNCKYCEADTVAGKKTNQERDYKLWCYFILPIYLIDYKSILYLREFSNVYEQISNIGAGIMTIHTAGVGRDRRTIIKASSMDTNAYKKDDVNLADVLSPSEVERIIKSQIGVSPKFNKLSALSQVPQNDNAKFIRYSKELLDHVNGVDDFTDKMDAIVCLSRLIQYLETPKDDHSPKYELDDYVIPMSKLHKGKTLEQVWKQDRGWFDTTINLATGSFKETLVKYMKQRGVNIEQEPDTEDDLPF
jgi:hypothetical protein